MANTAANMRQWIKLEAQRMRPLLEFADELDKAGSLEKLVRDKELAVAELDKQAASRDDLIVAARAQAAKIVEDAKKQAASIAEAFSNRQAIAVKDADEVRKRAGQLLTDAETEIRKRIVDADAKLKKSADELDKIMEQIQLAATRKAEVEAQAAAAEQRKAAALAEVDRLKKVFA